MADVRSCVSILLLFVILEQVASKPFFGSLWCDYFCDDEDDSSSEDYDFCIGCNPRPRRRTTTTPMAPPSGSNPSMQFMIPPGQGVNATLTQFGTSWLLNLTPMGSLAGAPGSSVANPAPAAPAAPAAPVAPAAPAATPAPAAATTAAGATTAAATTAVTTAAAGK